MRRSGVRHRVGDITLVVSPGQPGIPRVAVVVGRAAGSAVRRNRARRRLREALRRCPLEEGRDYVVTGSSQVAVAPFEKLVSWLTRALEEVGTCSDHQKRKSRLDRGW